MGGESTRPGADEVPAAEEIARTEPVVAGLAEAGIAVSIDTSKAAVAEAALDAGARMVNDVTALVGDPELAALCADRGCEVVLMHMQGTPRTMQENPIYDDVVDDVRAFLAGADRGRQSAAGIAEDADLGRSRASDSARPSSTTSSCCGASASCASSAGRSSSAPRARASSARSPAARSASGSGARSPPTSWRLRAGAEMLRVHDVSEMREAALVAETILDPDSAWTSA